MARKRGDNFRGHFSFPEISFPEISFAHPEDKSHAIFHVTLLLLSPVIYQRIDQYVNHYLCKVEMANNDYSKKTGKGLTSIYE
ncbi:MAG: hypothetical protein WGN25_10325 [Candidatus Electrothrix sp. GW3-4]|uniref:hypothetical protein n=1 Tax=Candidatus Electrothrix sp. GW3-4 TaxID=3126740 RepID=UPI0030CBBD6A